jgi:hypothetical protein
MSEEVLLSPEGLAKLKSELENLKGPERQRIAEAIREAKSHGDLRENAMYHEAKLNQKRLEQRIAELEHTLNVAQVVDPTKATGAHLGNKVVLEDFDHVAPRGRRAQRQSWRRSGIRCPCRQEEVPRSGCRLASSAGCW